MSIKTIHNILLQTKKISGKPELKVHCLPNHKVLKPAISLSFYIGTYFNQRDLQPRPRSVAKEKEMKKQKETEKKDEQSLQIHK